MGRTRRTITGILAATAWWLISCRDVPAPEGGVLSISTLLLPSPGVVAGDTIRDSTGLAAPLRVIAYGESGETLSVTPTFVVLDTGAHFADGGVLLVGDSVGRTVRIVGTVGPLQTKPDSVRVTLSPDTLVPADSILHRKSYALISGDTAVNTGDLGAIVQHDDAALSGVRAVIVRYTIDKAPPAAAGKGPSIVLLNASIASDRDTSDTNGKVARSARLRLGALTSFATDTAIISATASYRGHTIGVVQFTLIFTSQ